MKERYFRISISASVLNVCLPLLGTLRRSSYRPELAIQRAYRKRAAERQINRSDGAHRTSITADPNCLAVLVNLVFQYLPGAAGRTQLRRAGPATRAIDVRCSGAVVSDLKLNAKVVLGPAFSAGLIL
jgi:hypothetical protein